MKPLTDLISTPDFKYITLSNDRFIRPSLKYYGEYCAEETELLAHFLPEDGVVLDIGANIGTHTLAFAKRVPQGEVWAFEPQKFVHQILAGNVALNGFTNVRTFHCAVGKETGEIGVPHINYATPDNYGGLDLRKYGGGAPEDYDMTPMISLDSLKLESVDLIKIDVDGMEDEVLRGGFQTVFRCRPVLYVEADRTEHRTGLIGFLSTLGYRIWEHRPALVNGSTPLTGSIDEESDAESRKHIAEMKTYHAINLICLPKAGDVIGADLVARFSLKPVLV